MSLSDKSLSTKAKMMKNTSLIISMTKKGDLDLAYQKFYDFLLNDPFFSSIIQDRFSYKEFKKVSSKLSMFGLTWEKGYYVPIAVFSFHEPLAFVVDNKEVFVKSSISSKEFIRSAYFVQEILFK